MNPEITFVYPYYNNAMMFMEQQRVWGSYPGGVRSRIEMIVTDDCSPRAPARLYVKEDRNFRLRLYRIGMDIRWNWIAAKNLGAHHAAEDSWLLLTDIDHVVPWETAAALLSRLDRGKLDRDRYYTFDRVDAPNLTPYKIHPNTYFMHRSLFWRIGGYDEDLSGFYGTDGYYRALVNRVCRRKEFHLNGVNMIRYPREVISDASTTDYQRKAPVDSSPEKREIMKRKLEFGLPPAALTFPWERIL
jgi:hypothetical protein